MNPEPAPSGTSPSAAATPLRRRAAMAACVAFVALLWTPVAQKAAGLFPEVVLGGVEVPAPSPPRTVTGWFGGKFQDRFEAAFVRKTGLRGFWIRTANQIRYSLFRQSTGAHADDVVIGRDGWLFIRGYVRAADRAKVFEEAKLAEAARQVRAFQDEMDRRGRAFLFVIAPNKAEIYAEFVPPYLFAPGRESRRSGYQQLLPHLEREGVRLLDLHAWFAEHRDDGPHPLFSRGGIHWSHYGAAVAARRILDRIEPQMGGRTLAKFRVAGAVVDDRPAGLDADIVDLMNIWNRRGLAGPQVHPVLEPEAPADALRPDILFVGDSFIFGLTPHLEAMDCYRRRDTFFYFNRRQTWPDGTDTPLDRARLDWDRDVFDRDAVVIVYSAMSLPTVNRGFLTGALAHTARARGAAPAPGGPK